VWDSAGNVVFDSGDQLERITADLTPALFNANDGLPAKVDQRSDDKGPEPEGITVGTVGGTPYAFVGLERAGGGIVAYDVSDPAAPEFATYGRFPTDISPEGLTFVPESDSPIEASLLIVANEVSNSVAIFAVVEPEQEADPAPGVRQVHPVLETRQVLDVDPEDVEADLRTGSADDPAIWVHPTDRSKSLVFGALKDGGLDTYDLDGKLVQEIAPEDIRYNNVDVAYGVKLGGKRVDIAVATDRMNDVLAIFRIDPQTRQLVDITDTTAPLIFAPEGEESDGSTTAYGIATWMAHNGKTYVFVNQRKRGTVAQLELVGTGDKLGWKKVRSFTLPTPAGGELEDAQCEGMVVDQQLGWLYVGQENVGIWKTRVEPNTGYRAELIHTVQSSYLEADVEGLSIYYGAGSRGYLLCSSQGDSTFAAFGRTAENRYLGQFQVTGEGTVDGSQDCDGASVISLPMGPRFPKGLLVVHDGYDDPAVMAYDDGEFENAAGNFKFVPWERVAESFRRELIIDTRSYDPRKR
jgi:myo-inositol-hexaphosphate 3-phosphohydrolase